MPLSSSPRIDRDEIIELLEESLHRLPDEMRQARWMIKERQEFVSKTRREADELLEAARVQAERMVQRTEVVRAAEQRARQISEAADADSRRLRHETEDFLDQRLGSFEILLDKLQKTVHAGRSRLSIGAHRDDEASRRRRPDQGLLRPRSRISPPAVNLDVMANPLLINAAELLRRPGSERRSTCEPTVAELGIVDPRFDPDATGRRSSLRLESLTDGIVVDGQIRRRGPTRAGAAWRRRRATVVSDVHELYQQVVTDPDAFEIVGDQIDLEPMVREHILLDAPIAPLCRPDCAGLCPTCGIDLNAGDLRLRRAPTSIPAGMR